MSGAAFAVAATAAAATIVSPPASAPAGKGAPTPVVVIDPGHDRLPNPGLEPIGPGSRQQKIKDGGGTRGVVTGLTEAEVALAVSHQLRMLLMRAGVRVVMTRTVTRGVSMGNVARARIANRARAALFVRVHADGSKNPADAGTHTLHPAYRPGWTDDIHAPSLRAARLIHRELVRALRSEDRGLDSRSDITGFNWSNVPAVLPELGFLTNPREDRLLSTRAYQQRAAVAMCRGVMRFLARPAESCRT